MQNSNPQGVASVAYRAVDGGLVVIYGDTKLHMPLPGWSLEQVGSIIVSIQMGGWTYLHDTMALGRSAHDYEEQRGLKMFTQGWSPMVC